MDRRGNPLSRILSLTLAAALVLLSPGLEPYRLLANNVPVPNAGQGSASGSTAGAVSGQLQQTPGESVVPSAGTELGTRLLGLGSPEGTLPPQASALGRRPPEALTDATSQTSEVASPLLSPEAATHETQGPTPSSQLEEGANLNAALESKPVGDESAKTLSSRIFSGQTAPAEPAEPPATSVTAPFFTDEMLKRRAVHKRLGFDPEAVRGKRDLHHDKGKLNTEVRGFVPQDTRGVLAKAFDAAVTAGSRLLGGKPRPARLVEMLGPKQEVVSKMAYDPLIIQNELFMRQVLRRYFPDRFDTPHGVGYTEGWVFKSGMMVMDHVKGHMSWRAAQGLTTREQADLFVIGRAFGLTDMNEGNILFPSYAGKPSLIDFEYAFSRYHPTPTKILWMSILQEMPWMTPERLHDQETYLPAVRSWQEVFAKPETKEELLGMMRKAGFSPKRAKSVLAVIGYNTAALPAALEEDLEYANRYFREHLKRHPKDRAARIREIREVLSYGKPPEVEPFRFRSQDGKELGRGRSAGLEGFLFSKRELERRYGREVFLHHLERLDYVKYLQKLVRADWAGNFRKELHIILEGAGTSLEKDELVTRLIVREVRRLHLELEALDPSLWVRGMKVYEIFARSYNRLKDGKNFLDSLDEEELERIRRDNPGTNTLWVLDLFENTELRLPGAIGDNPYSIRRYRVKEEWGGDAAFKAFVERAHRMGFKVIADFVPNHLALDSDLAREHPEAFLHIVPPQHLSDEEILRLVPAEGDRRIPRYRLVETDRYPDPSVRKILVHHPILEQGEDRYDVWIDMLQLDPSQPAARAFLIEETRRLVREFDLDGFRRDMAYELVNAHFFGRWEDILSREYERAAPELKKPILNALTGLLVRREALAGREILREMTEAVKEVKPDAVVIEEAYAFLTDLERAGADAVYNKNDHDLGLGQHGLYDAIQSRDPGWIDNAASHLGFRTFQRGGAALMSFQGTHDGGEGNPVDKFQRFYKVVALTTLLLRPLLFYAGQERGVGQREGLKGDLSKSEDLHKDIPFDVLALLNWEVFKADNRDHIKLLGSESSALWARPPPAPPRAAGRTSSGSLRSALRAPALDILERQDGNALNAFVLHSPGPAGQTGKTLLVAANYTDHPSAGHFKFKPVLPEFGGFAPQPDREYILKDWLHRDSQGKPTVYRRSGGELLDKGLYLALDSAQGHLFEVEEEAPSTGPIVPSRDVEETASPPTDKPATAFQTWWTAFTERLVNTSAVLFTFLQLPQILTNILNLASDHPEKLSILPPDGYAMGIVGNSLLLSFAVFSKEKAWSRVQLAGVLTSSIVLTQIFQAGFASPAFFWPFALAVGGYLAALAAQWKEMIPRKVEAAWKKAAQAMGWTATFFFMYGPAAQLWYNRMHPDQISGISEWTLLIAMAGNLLMLPKALLKATTGPKEERSWMWFIGSSWGVYLGGWAVLRDMFAAGAVASPIFWAATALSAAALAATVWTDRRAKDARISIESNEAKK